MTFDDIAGLYTRYIGDWGQEATTYRFEALQNGGVFAQVIKGASSNVYLKVTVDRNDLIDAVTYDVATLRIRAEDEHGNLLSYYQEPIKMTLSGPITRIGPDLLVLRGGQTGTYIKTTGQSGKAEVILRSPTGQEVRIPFSVTHVPQVDPTSPE
ncbi:hypothetical protein [Fusibacter tunisiensis]|uniref:Uncharacterized protein n=1 Tax=Fusibacter tunisiensis TaxID=1008308 RepID=A0ABS2MSR2_9FIRM|nr:hypothetical protein [Fusibacter tunisiensis]MBM7562439.1 hypothetical protein [Fusibacter tunisiensis]